jgi:hypothetical protein
MLTDRSGQNLGFIMPTGQEIPPFRHRLGSAVDAADRLDRQHGMQAGPATQSLQIGRLGADENPATDKTTMTIIEFVENSPARRISIDAGAGEVVGNRPVRLTVIAFQSQYVISAAIDDFLGDRRLAPHGIQRDDPVLDHQLLEQSKRPSEAAALD